jgi:hypothetical protein
MSNQDGLDPKELGDLIARLSQRKQESPSDTIPFKDIQEILQTEGLIEPFVQESLTAQHQQLVASKQRNKRQRSWMLKGFTVTTIALAGAAAWGGYSIGAQWTIDGANQAAQSAQNSLSEKNKNLETKVGELESQIKVKDEQIKDLINKIGTGSPIVSPSPSVSSSPFDQ